MSLTEVKVRNAKPKDKPYNLSDGRGLYLEVRPSGAKFWRYRFWLTPTKDGRYTIGEYPYVTLAKAREEAEWARGVAKEGINPTDKRKREMEDKEKEKENTFKAISEEWLLRKEKTIGEWTIYKYRRALIRNCYPAFGDKPIKDVTSSDILKVMKSLESAGSPSVSIRVRFLCASVFKYAISNLKTDYDPSQPLSGAIIKPKTNHSRCLSREEIKLYFDRLNSSNSSFIVKSFLRILPFVFVRQSELRFSSWGEFDFDNKIWVIGGEKMKMGRNHSVPLSCHVISLLNDIKLNSKENRDSLIFSVNGTKEISSVTPNNAIEKMGFKRGEITCHDFRATASTMLYEMGFRREVIEKQLSHSERNKTIAAYNHAEYMAERREMMNIWEKTLLDIINS
ncbi:MULTISPECIES: tyrosine-type recombinase/integrase [unclassified Xenorhabdus]|uniref:tyrosine-type recombinase/integrase n=1 Tax=unclassified Xenorhabdus TaxID=2632833 RepID=UPI000C04B38F|nr:MULTISPECIES: integrase arm-type DNA-binding domain-containing protein [unclassified Xenorhabdus]MCC8378678.1 tyrosine-type recombinase/integrase [Xenorhabdus sp. PB30.3]PHM52531.1 integrase [Xenorhabdus sp. KK7.4]